MDVPKRYNPAESEPRWQAFWEEEGLYRHDPQHPGEVFSVDTPPPYVSAAHLHVGHAMSYTQAEIIVRYQRMRGRSIFYPMGFDDNGLPTERFVETKYKLDKSTISRAEFIDLCLKETRLGGQTYLQLWKALGLSCDWSTLYSTIDPRCRTISQRSFLDLYARDRIARREDPINWCPMCQTALAQADIELEEQASTLYTIAFRAVDDGAELRIATTRPELLPACVALYVNPEDERYRGLVGRKAMVPFSGQEVVVRTDAAVDPAFGTGLMMVCTWGDAEDVRKWKEHGLDTRIAIAPDGTMTDLTGVLAGLPLPEARKRIVAELTEAGLILGQQRLTHQVGTHERCHTTVEFNHAPQWFIRVLDLKPELLERGRELTWYPPHFRTQYENWVEGLKWDWCISRQRYYGVPFPVWFCSSCGEVKLARDQDLPVDPMVDRPHGPCSRCGGTEFTGEKDVMDTWMTSSLTPMINARWGQPDDSMARLYPLTVRVQAFEIIRTWLFYTVVKAHLHTSSLPFREAMISGWGLDKNGKKMSKRSGNFVTPEDMIQKYSADALRYWSAGAHLGANLNFLEEEVANGKKLLTKMWNAAKFVMSHLGDADLGSYRDTVPADLPLLDRGVVSVLHKVIDTATASLDRYEFSKAKVEIERFFWMDLCDNYLEIVKDILYKPEEYSADRRASGQWTCWHLFTAVLSLFAPYIPHLTEELYQLYVRPVKGVKSLHVTSWPTGGFSDPGAEAAYNVLVSVVKQVRRFKTAQNVALNTPVRLVLDAESKALEETLLGLAPELRSATRYTSLETGSATALVEGRTDLRVDITLAEV